MDRPRFARAGVNAMLMTLAETPSETLLNRIFAMQQWLTNEKPPWLVDIIPAYVTLYIVFDPVLIDRFTAQRWMTEAWSALESKSIHRPKQHIIPVYYAPDLCPDLDIVAAMKGMAIEDVITLHCAHVYRVYALGFAPGFAYLGELDEQLRVPRLATPRQNIPAGSVAIAEQQTAIYPASSPAGWHVLGLCPLDLKPTSDDLQTTFAVGDEVRFEAIDKDTFISLGGHCEVVS